MNILYEFFKTCWTSNGQKVKKTPAVFSGHFINPCFLTATAFTIVQKFSIEFRFGDDPGNGSRS